MSYKNLGQSTRDHLPNSREKICSAKTVGHTHSSTKLAGDLPSDKLKNADCVPYDQL